MMDDADAPKKVKPRRKPAPQKRLGDIKVTKAALDVLRAVADGGHILASRIFPHDFHLQLHFRPATGDEHQKSPDTLNDTLMDALVRTQCIATETPSADVRLYRITERGRAALRGEGFDPVPEQGAFFPDS